jgi:hypothetical protein
MAVGHRTGRGLAHPAGSSPSRLEGLHFLFLPFASCIGPSLVEALEWQKTEQRQAEESRAADGEAGRHRRARKAEERRAGRGEAGQQRRGGQRRGGQAEERRAGRGEAELFSFAKVAIAIQSMSESLQKHFFADEAQPSPFHLPLLRPPLLRPPLLRMNLLYAVGPSLQPWSCLTLGGAYYMRLSTTKEIKAHPQNPSN